MRNLFGMICLSLVFLIHCGGEATSTAHAEEVDSDFQTEVASGFKDAAITGAGGNVAVDAGFAADGTVIALPAGFTAGQCKLTAALATLDGSSISAQVSIDHDTGRVVCQKVVQERVEIPPEVKGCTASYIIVCAK